MKMKKQTVSPRYMDEMSQKNLVARIRAISWVLGKVEPTTLEGDNAIAISGLDTNGTEAIAHDFGLEVVATSGGFRIFARKTRYGVTKA